LFEETLTVGRVLLVFVYRERNILAGEGPDITVKREVE